MHGATPLGFFLSQIPIGHALLGQVRDSIGTWVPRPPAVGWREVDREVLQVNVSRLRLVCWVMIACQLILLAADAVEVYQLRVAGRVVDCGGVLLVTEIRLIRVVLSGAFLVATRRKSLAGSAGRLSGLAVQVYVVGCLATAGPQAGLNPQGPFASGLYLLAIDTAACLLYLRGWRAVVAFGSAWVGAAIALWARAARGLPVAPDALDVTMMTVVAFVGSQFLFSMWLKELLNRQLIDRQRAEVEKANRLLAETNEALRRQTLIDSLTGIPNRRSLDQALHRALSRRGECASRGLLMFMDLDNFKPVNDALGHAAGDLALGTVARVLKESLRAEDLLARVGGDEFAVLLVEADLDAGLAVADRLRAAIADHLFEYEGRTFHLALSVGIVDLSDQRDPASALALADAAMYRAKERGGDQVSPPLRPCMAGAAS